jgi:hypothetical protein
MSARDEAVEVVARAMYESMRLKTSKRWDDRSDDYKRAFYDEAHLYIDALSTAGYLATDELFGVAYDADALYVKGVSTREMAEREVDYVLTGTKQYAQLVSRRVTPWRSA